MVPVDVSSGRLSFSAVGMRILHDRSIPKTPEFTTWKFLIGARQSIASRDQVPNGRVHGTSPGDADGMQPVVHVVRIFGLDDVLQVIGSLKNQQFLKRIKA